MGFMQNSLQASLDRDSYDRLVTFVHDRCFRLFGNRNFCSDASNLLLMSQLQAEEQQTFDKSELETLFPKLIEDLFDAYRKTAFTVCLSKTHDPELSGDLAQEAVYQLLASKGEIRNVNFWLKQVTHNLLCKHYKDKKDEQTLCQSLMNEEAVIRDVMQNNIPSAIEGLNQEQTEEILNSKEYEAYQSTIGHESLEAFAAFAGISYEAAKKRRAKALRDLRARMLLMLGWANSPDILSFSRYIAIQKFLRKLSAIARGEEETKDVRLKQVLEGFSEIFDWGISLAGSGKYCLYIACLSDAGIPRLATLYLRMNKRNHIIIEGSKRNQIMGVLDTPDNFRLPIEKGMVTLSLEEIKTMVKPLPTCDC